MFVTLWQYFKTSKTRPGFLSCPNSALSQLQWVAHISCSKSFIIFITGTSYYLFTRLGLFWYMKMRLRFLFMLTVTLSLLPWVNDLCSSPCYETHFYNIWLIYHETKEMGKSTYTYPNTSKLGHSLVGLETLVPTLSWTVIKVCNILVIKKRKCIK